MLLKFATRRNKCGNRLYLQIDTEKKQYCTDSQIWYDGMFIEVTKTDYRLLKDLCDADGYHVYMRISSLGFHFE